MLTTVEIRCKWCSQLHAPEDVLEVQNCVWICRGCADKIKDYAAFDGIDLHNFRRKE